MPEDGKGVGADCPGPSAPDAARLVKLLIQCEQDTRRLLGPKVADLLASRRKYSGDPQALVRDIQRWIPGPKRNNGRRLDRLGGLSLERVVIDNSSLLTAEDVRVARETSAGHHDW